MPAADHEICVEQVACPGGTVHCVGLDEIVPVCAAAPTETKNVKPADIAAKIFIVDSFE